MKPSLEVNPQEVSLYTVTTRRANRTATTIPSSKAETGRIQISFQHLLECCLQKHICPITLGGYFVVIVRGWIFYSRSGIFSTRIATHWDHWPIGARR